MRAVNIQIIDSNITVGASVDIHNINSTAFKRQKIWDTIDQITGKNLLYYGIDWALSIKK